MFAQNILCEKTKVLVVSECVLFVDGLRQIYNGKSSFSIVRTLNAERNLSESAKIIRPEIIIFEVSNYSNLDLEQIKQLNESGFSGKLLLLIDASGIGNHLHSMLSLGVDGYIPRNSGYTEMTNALTVVSNDGLYFPELSSKHIDNHATSGGDKVQNKSRQLDELNAGDTPNECLSNRELVVLRKMALGLCMKQIASDINLSSKTVDTYRSRAMKKLNLSDRHAVVKHAVRSGWMNGL